MSVSVRAKRFWEKLRDWYGTSLTDQYGDTPPSDWCELIDDADNDTVKLALSEIRSKHLTFPPRFPEVDSIFAKLRRVVSPGPLVQEQLADFVLRNYRLTSTQLRLPWRYLYTGHSGYPGSFDDPKRLPSPDYAVVGVEIPADGDATGYRVMVVDMQAEAA